jgi:hypothetical protein
MRWGERAGAAVDCLRPPVFFLERFAGRRGRLQIHVRLERPRRRRGLYRTHRERADDHRRRQRIGLLAGASLTGFNLSGQTYYGTAPRLLSTSPSAQYFFSSTTEEALGLKAGGSLIAIRSSSIMVATDSGSTFIGYPLAEGGIGRAIESQSLVPAPAPLPGAGWMSWLLVGGFAAWRRRTHASAATVGALVNAMRRKIGGLRLDRPGNGGGKSAPAPAQTA